MKFIGYFNTLGVFALAILCAVQWQANGRINRRAIDLEKTRQEHLQKIAEEDRTIKGDASDLEDFRRRLEQSDAALREAEGKIVTLGMERDRAAAERDAAMTARDRMKATLEKWVSAVKERDESLKKGNDEIRKLAAERNDAVVKFNALAERYNSVIKDLNMSRGK
ncbi:MAG TPA: hypothetical protein VG326_02165 [Tepidisphaeraceae bacterium]|jgi:chromosome segregation ATPase|nr:hypothetical protein [Tepidisphaeraceae bacterium]